MYHQGQFEKLKRKVLLAPGHGSQENLVNTTPGNARAQGEQNPDLSTSFNTALRHQQSRASNNDQAVDVGAVAEDMATTGVQLPHLQSNLCD
jgi:hypothetical protein